jgi:hypothetical protein
MEFKKTNQGRILTSKLYELERERDNLDHQINIEKIQSDYNINSLKYSYRNGNFNDFHDPQARHLSNIVRLNEKRDKLNSEIEAIQIQLLQEMSIFEEEQRKKKEEKVRISTEQFINFTNTLSDEEIEEFQKRYEEGKKEQRYRKYMSLRQETEQN